MTCCFRVHQPDENNVSANLNTLQTRSVISVHLPLNTVPHASSKCNENSRDDDALREIFRSPHSVRGYQTASEGMHLPPPRRPSFDLDFKFGSHDVESKATSRLEQFGNHIKQRLSEGRLSKAISADQGVSEVNIHSPSPLGRDDAEASMSQKSNGLLELLMSRTGSERGYDSDAKSIQTMTLKASDGIIKPGSLVAAKEPPKPLDTSLLVPLSPIRLPQDDNDSRVETGKSPFDHDPPTKLPQTSFTDALLAEKDSVPTVALQRLSTGISNGTVKLPSSYNSNGILTHATIKEKEPANIVDSSSEEPIYSTVQQVDILSTLNRLGNSVVAAQRDSLISLPDSDVRASIVSSLDPTFIDFISRFAELDQPKDDQCSSDLCGGPSSTITKENIFSSTSHDSTSYAHKASDHPRQDLKSYQGSDQASVHLYNMRISQNLASPSLGAYTSRPTTSHTMISHSMRPSLDMDISTRGKSGGSLASRRSTTEHNRRPSDPQTRRLFEDDKASNMRAQLKTEISCNSGVSDLNLKSVRARDDGSSFYWSENELSPSHNSSKMPPKRNANSLAIGGRSESISYPVTSSMRSIDKVSETEDDVWFTRNASIRITDRGQIRHVNSQRSRSTSMPVRSRPDHLDLATRGRRLNSTEDNEKLSEISTGALEDVRRENLTEVSVQAIHDAHNERMSEIDRTTPFNDSNRMCSLHDSVSLDRRRSRNGSSQSKDTRTHWQRRKLSTGGAFQDLNSPQLPESTNDMWRRTFRQAATEHDESVGGLFFTPGYDRDGRRRKSKSSVSNVAREEVDTTASGSQTHSGHSKIAISPEREVNVEQEQLPHLLTLTENNNKRKKSLLEIGRRLTGTISKDGSQNRPENTTPLKDIIGL